jgi:hypothetical protein
MPVLSKEINHAEYLANSFKDYLIDAAPEVLWFDVQEKGYYQGEVYAIGLYQNKILIFEGYYGSCGGCGAWGEGGEPTNIKEVLESSTLFEEDKAAFECCESLANRCESPNVGQCKAAVNEAIQFRNAKKGSKS